ncbi:hypothetical protein WUBG_08689 [Wuchereria bancrofti]|uniref:Uncharacterized protein n=1 Tax=Wuchereria bancrofti TaxID=6293 RepID=J9ETG7_WUCBA|nr:hypothetical protein WUBG_08689 [Wuchereria bancrofti]
MITRRVIPSPSNRLIPSLQEKANEPSTAQLIVSSFVRLYAYFMFACCVRACVWNVRKGRGEMGMNDSLIAFAFPCYSQRIYIAATLSALNTNSNACIKTTVAWCHPSHRLMSASELSCPMCELSVAPCSADVSGNHTVGHSS